MANSGCKSAWKVRIIKKDRLYAVKTKLNQGDAEIPGLSTISYFLKTDNQLVIFDTSFNIELIDFDLLSPDRLTPQEGLEVVIAQTHGHLDHSGATKDVKDKYNAQVYISGYGLHEVDGKKIFHDPEREEELIFGGKREEFGLPVKLKPFEIERVLDEGDEFYCGDIKINTFTGPGHSQDHLYYTFDLDGVEYIVCGDIVNPNGVKLEPKYLGSSPDALVETITKMRDQALNLKTEKPHVILAGHNIEKYETNADLVEFLEQSLREAEQYRDSVAKD